MRNLELIGEGPSAVLVLDTTKAPSSVCAHWKGIRAVTDALDSMRRKQEYSPRQIAEWIPRGARSSISDIGFDKPIETWKDDAVGRQDFVEAVLTRLLVDGAPASGLSPDFGEGKSSETIVLADD